MKDTEGTSKKYTSTLSELLERSTPMSGPHYSKDIEKFNRNVKLSENEIKADEATSLRIARGLPPF